VNELTNITAQAKAGAIVDTISCLYQRFHLHILYKYIKNFTAVFFIHKTMRYLSTADIDTFICQFKHFIFLLAMETPVWKTFKHLQRMLDKCSGGDII